MSFSPKYIITDKILFNIKEITKLGVEFNSKKLSPKTYSQLSQETYTRSAKALSLSEQEAKNYTSALEKFSKKNMEFNTNLILSLHTEVLKENAGKFKNDNIKNNVKNLVKFVNSNRDTDPVILAGLFYKQFLMLSPFIFANEKVAILCTRILLRNLDIHMFNLFSFERIGEVIHNDNTKWLEHFTQVVLNEMLRLKKGLNNVNINEEFVLNEDQKKILKYLEKYSVIDDSRYSKITKRKKATRVLDFNKLIACGFIERCGRGRKTHYILK